MLDLKTHFNPPEEHVKDASLSAYRCPKCRNKGRWRTGVHFDHEKICCTTWCPADIEDYRNCLARELAGCSGDGI